MTVATPNRYTPAAQRDVTASMYTTAGWITGSVMIPKLRIFSEFVNAQREFLKLRNVRLPGLDKDIPFFLLQRSSIVLMIPIAGDSLETSMGPDRSEHQVSCAFANGVVSGTIELLKGVRVSDFLTSRAGMFVIRNSNLFIRGDVPPDQPRTNIPYLLVNSDRLIGVSEPRFV